MVIQVMGSQYRSHMGAGSVTSNVKSDHTEVVVKDGGTCYWEYRQDNQVTRGEAVAGNEVWLRTTWGLDGMARFAYSLDGKDFQPWGEPYQMTWGNYRGDRLGVYCFNDKAEAGWVDVDFFHYR